MNVYRFNRTAGTYTAADIKATAWAIYAASIREFMCSTYSDVRVPRHDQRYKFSRETATASAPAPTCAPPRPSGFVIRF